MLHTSPPCPTRHRHQTTPHNVPLHTTAAEVSPSPLVPARIVQEDVVEYTSMGSASSEAAVNSLTSKTKIASKDGYVDIFKDTPLRYLGYANEVGEALGPIYPRAVASSYAIAFAYVGGDTIDKAYRSYQQGKPGMKSCQIAADTFIWQLFASGMSFHIVNDSRLSHPSSHLTNIRRSTHPRKSH